jgi:hypothetical protein
LPYQDNNGAFVRGEPLLDHPVSAPPGWFVGIDLSVLGPHIKNRLQAPVTVNGFEPNTVHLPTAELDWVGSPRFELGYRFPEGVGELLVSYRFLATEGSDTLSAFDLDGSEGFLKSRLNLDVVDIDYASCECSLYAHWTMKWRVGVRIADVFFSSRADGLFIEQRTSNNFVGAGPHVGLDLWRSLSIPGLALFGRIEGAGVIGEIHQSFEEKFFLDDGRLVGGATTAHDTQFLPVLTFRTGLSWTPCRNFHWSRFAFGYELEQWWNLGEAGGSHAELTTQGIFFSGEFTF